MKDMMPKTQRDIQQVVWGLFQRRINDNIQQIRFSHWYEDTIYGEQFQEMRKRGGLQNSTPAQISLNFFTFSYELAFNHGNKESESVIDISLLSDWKILHVLRMMINT